MALHLQATMKTDDGDSSNYVVNTWNISYASPGQVDDVLLALDNFYGTTPEGQANAVSSFFSPYLQQSGGLTIKAYDLTDHLDGSPMGSPIEVYESSLAAPQAGEALPSHIACVLTLEGLDRADAPVEDPGPPVTRPKQRRTGRVYLGPLNINAIAPGPSNDSKPDPTFTGVVFAALADMRDELAAIDPLIRVGVWSRSNEVLYVIDAASIDDRLDVVKTRKRSTTTRTRVLL